LVNDAVNLIFSKTENVPEKIRSYKNQIEKKMKENIEKLLKVEDGSLEMGIFRVEDDTDPTHLMAKEIKKGVRTINYFQPIESDLTEFIKNYQRDFDQASDPEIDRYLAKIDKPNQESLNQLLKLLKKVANDENSSMDANNLARIFAPNFFPNPDLSVLAKQIKFVEHLINR
jgi:hypothetical protein